MQKSQIKVKSNLKFGKLFIFDRKLFFVMKINCQRKAPNFENRPIWLKLDITFVFDLSQIESIKFLTLGLIRSIRFRCYVSIKRRFEIQGCCFYKYMERNIARITYSYLLSDKGTHRAVRGQLKIPSQMEVALQGTQQL